MKYVIDYARRGDGTWAATSPTQGLESWSLHADGCDLAQKTARAEIMRMGSGCSPEDITEVIRPPAQD